MPGQRPASETSIVSVVVCAAVFSIAAFLIHEVYEIDVWWHVAIGRDILASGSVPQVDRYSIAGLGRAYHDSHWLFQVVLASLHRLLGMGGVQLAAITIWSATLVTVYHSCRRWVGIGSSAILVYLVAMSSVERFLPRPEIVTVLMLAIFYDRYQAAKFESWRDIAVLGFLQCLWSNSHGLFVLGPFVAACYWISALPVWIRSREGNLVSLTRALMAVLLGTLITPFGLEGWRYALLLFREGGVDRPAVFQSLGELGPVFSSSFRSSPAFWFFGSLLALSLVTGSIAAIRRRLSLPRTLIVLAMAGLALTGRRNVVLFAVVAAPFIAESGRSLLALEAKKLRWFQLGAAVLMLAFAAYPLSGAFYVDMELPARFGIGPSPSFFPRGLGEYLDESGFAGRVLQSNTLGGFYLYQGFPDRLPLTDGRWEVYDEEELNWILWSSRQPGRWQDVVRRYGLTGVLLAHTSPEATAILPEISQASDWQLAYLDRGASFWLDHRVAGDQPPLALPEPETVERIDRIDDAIILNAFFEGIGARDLQRATLERALVLGGRDLFVLERLGKAEVALGRLDEAEERFSRLLELDPHHVEALNQLAFIAFQKGDLQEAVRIIGRAVELEPDNQLLRENLDRVEKELRKTGN